MFIWMRFDPNFCSSTRVSMSANKTQCVCLCPVFVLHLGGHYVHVMLLKLRSYSLWVFCVFLHFNLIIYKLIWILKKTCVRWPAHDAIPNPWGGTGSPCSPPGAQPGPHVDAAAGPPPPSPAGGRGQCTSDGVLAGKRALQGTSCQCWWH